MLRVAAATLGMALLFGGDSAADLLRANFDRGLFVSEDDDRRAGPDPLFPAFREFFATLRVARINAALSAGDPQRALRYAREALALVPDRAELRVRVANVLAFDLPPVELEGERRVAWIFEALRLLDEGIAARPDSAFLRHHRGRVLILCAKNYPEFDRAFEQSYGVAAIDAGVDAFQRAAELAPYVRDYRMWAGLYLMVRGTIALDAAVETTPRIAAGMQRAAADFGAAAALLRTFAGTHDPFARIADATLAYIDVARAEALYLAGGGADPQRIATFERERDAKDRERSTVTGD